MNAPIIIICLLFLQFSTATELLHRSEGWLFGYNHEQMCRVRLQNHQIQLNLTQIYGHQSYQYLAIPSSPHYCNPQACIPLSSGPALLCQNYTDYKFMLIDSLTQKTMDLKGKMMRYDSGQRLLAVWNGHRIEVFRIDMKGNVGRPYASVQPIFNPNSHLTDMHIYKEQVYFLINGSVFEINSTDGHLHRKMYTGLYTFPFQFSNLDAIPFVVSEIKSNMDNIFSSLAFPILSLLEFAVLIVIAYYCKWKVYKGRDGRLTINPHHDSNSSEDSNYNPYFPTVEEKAKFSKS